MKINANEKLQWFVDRLKETYFYPEEFIEERKENINIQDIVGIKLKTYDGFPFMHIFIQDGKESKILDYINLSGILGIHIVTDGTVKGTKFYSKKSVNSGLDYIPDMECYKVRSNPPMFVKTVEQGDSNSTQILLTDKVENLFFEIHSYIRDIDGLHMDEALDELCKLLFCKLLDEHQTNIGQIYKLQKNLYGTIEELAITVREMYANANKANFISNEYSSIFNNEIKLSSAAINKIVEVLQSFNLKDSNVDIKGRAFQKVLSPAIRAGMGQYFTPLQIIELSVNIVKPKSKELILDPFCGSSNFLSKSFDYIMNNEKDETNNIYGIEKSDRMIRIAMTDLILKGKNLINLKYSDSLLDFRNYENLKESMFDIVLTNPPFGSILGEEAFMQLGKFDLVNGYKSVPLEIVGIERAIQFLRPGGRMAIVLPDGILTNKRMESVRNWIEKHMKIRAIISLPTETFSPFGANIKTSILILRKWNVNEMKDINYKVCMCQINNIGYDAAGRIKKNDELEEAQKSVTEFLDREGW
ncbi:HsdM family class I SAM-dependent methyltransferase [Bacillus tropicus]|uniref:HsdM family class I SAM-dependent methyltransferase n=1 Tax=Bacillus tropicus TaxID=2026188 RepID=UPI00119E9612|nr:N-6 DNA methylase [Bacillus tropicus]